MCTRLIFEGVCAVTRHSWNCFDHVETRLWCWSQKDSFYSPVDLLSSQFQYGRPSLLSIKGTMQVQRFIVSRIGQVGVIPMDLFEFQTLIWNWKWPKDAYQICPSNGRWGIGSLKQLSINTQVDSCSALRFGTAELQPGVDLTLNE